MSNVFEYFNDTQRIVGIHNATWSSVHSDNKEKIQPLEVRKFILPEGSHPWVKMWDYGGESGLRILVSYVLDEDAKNNDINVELESSICEIQKEIDIFRRLENPRTADVIYGLETAKKILEGKR